MSITSVYKLVCIYFFIKNREFPHWYILIYKSMVKRTDMQ